MAKEFTYRPPRQMFVADTGSPLPAPIISKPEKTIPELKAAIEAIPAKRRGRTPKGQVSLETQKPWEADGVSRKTWYARRKKEQGK